MKTLNENELGGVRGGSDGPVASWPAKSYVPPVPQLPFSGDGGDIAPRHVDN